MISALADDTLGSLWPNRHVQRLETAPSTVKRLTTALVNATLFPCRGQSFITFQLTLITVVVGEFDAEFEMADVLPPVTLANGM